MAQPRFEVALGVIDGVNRFFVVSTGYIPNTTAVFVNGKLYRRDWDDGWDETNPAVGSITLKEAPLAGDTVQVFFTDSASMGSEEEVTTLTGRILEVSELRGQLLEGEIRLAVVHEIGDIDGRLLDAQLVLGGIKDLEVLHAQLHEVYC
jgi:hypothetical protein